jgi:hypothetical protein
MLLAMKKQPTTECSHVPVMKKMYGKKNESERQIFPNFFLTDFSISPCPAIQKNSIK